MKAYKMIVEKSNNPEKESIPDTAKSKQVLYKVS